MDVMILKSHVAKIVFGIKMFIFFLFSTNFLTRNIQGNRFQCNLPVMSNESENNAISEKTRIKCCVLFVILNLVTSQVLMFYNQEK